MSPEWIVDLSKIAGSLATATRRRGMFPERIGLLTGSSTFALYATDAIGSLKSESSASKIFRYFGLTAAIKTTSQIFTRVGPDNSLERLAERSVGFVTDRPSNVDELFVTLFE